MTRTATAADPNALSQPASLDAVPPGRVRTGRAVLRIATRVPKVRAARSEHRPSPCSAFLKGTDRWQVSCYAGSDEIAQVTIVDRTGAVQEAWTGPQVAWTMARGYPGAFGRKVNAPYVWIPLLVLFVVPFVDPRRPLRVRHLDLLVLCSFSVSLAFFNDGDIDASVPLAYPPLLYLLGRLLWIALRRRRRREPLRLLVPASWLAVVAVFLLGFRIGLNVTDSNVIDVGYAGVIGADKLDHGDRLYGAFPKDNEHGDTYGPVNYAAYVPFVLAFGWSGTWDDLPAAHGAAVLFDLLCVGGLFLLGRRVRGPTLGIVLAYAWLSFPFTLYAMNTGSNDSLVAALLVGVLLVATHPARRGALAALAGLTKFAPLALAPVLATHGAAGRRRVVAFGVAFAVVAAIALLPVWLQGDLRGVYDRTLGYQVSRGSPFSVWGLYDGLGAVHLAWQLAAVALALGAAFVPRRPDVIGLAALAGAIVVALQLGVTHWFYLYIAWFLPFALLALLAPDGSDPQPA